MLIANKIRGTSESPLFLNPLYTFFLKITNPLLSLQNPCSANVEMTSDLLIFNENERGGLIIVFVHLVITTIILVSQRRRYKKVLLIFYVEIT